MDPIFYIPPYQAAGSGNGGEDSGAMSVVFSDATLTAPIMFSTSFEQDQAGISQSQTFLISAASPVASLAFDLELDSDLDPTEFSISVTILVSDADGSNTYLYSDFFPMTENPQVIDATGGDITGTDLSINFNNLISTAGGVYSLSRSVMISRFVI